MAKFDNTNRGVLFVNNSKTADNQPDYTGKVNMDGEEKRAAAWVNESKDGSQRISIVLSDFQES